MNSSILIKRFTGVGGKTVSATRQESHSAVNRPGCAEAQTGSSASTAEVSQNREELRLLHRFGHHGDAAAFGEIARRYAPLVYGACLRIIGNSSRAEDLSQETFYRLILRWQDVRQSLGAWLHQTATHLALDALRSDSARRRREITYVGEACQPASTWAELSPAVDLAICDLPADLRYILVQHYLSGRSQADLAAELQLSPATLSRRVDQALQRLRDHLRLKGVYALPAMLAALLCHVAARPAPACLMRELLKMGLIGSPTAPPIPPRHCLTRPSLARRSLIKAHRALCYSGDRLAMLVPYQPWILFLLCLLAMGSLLSHINAIHLPDGFGALTPSAVLQPHEP